MHEFFLDLSLPAGLLLFSLIIVVYGVSVYLLSHLLVKGLIRKHHEKVGRVLFRVSASLLALILSISFANQRVNYFKVANSLETEAAKFVALYMDLNIYGTAESENIRTKIRQYIKEVSRKNWEYLFDDPANSKEFSLFKEIYRDVYLLTPESEMQESLKESMVEDVQSLADLIQVQLYSTRPESNNLFYTTILGILICMFLLSIYKPDRLTLAMATGYTAFLGLVLYFILMMTSPLEGPLQIRGEPFNLLAEIIENQND